MHSDLISCQNEAPKVRNKSSNPFLYSSRASLSNVFVLMTLEARLTSGIRSPDRHRVGPLLVTLVAGKRLIKIHPPTNTRILVFNITVVVAVVPSSRGRDGRLVTDRSMYF